MIYALLLMTLFTSCMSIKEKPRASELPGKAYRVLEGDTLSMIALKYNVDIDEIMEINGIDNARSLRAGRIIFVPDPDLIGQRIKNFSSSKAKIFTKNDRELAKKETTPISSKKIMEFPVKKGVIIREFSRNKKTPYDGIGIKADYGQEIMAAMDGKVIFVGDDKTKFGLIVIIEHKEPYITVYTHLDKAYVRALQNVKTGNILGTVGTSGGAEFAHLHFQVRVDQRPKNPRLFFKTTPQRP